MQHFGILPHEPRPLPLFLQILLQQTENDLSFRREVLAGLRAYEAAERHQRPPEMPEILQEGRARVLDYGISGRPVLFVPSLINPPHVLDLAENNSLLRWLARQGVRPLLLDWGGLDEGAHGLTVAGHIETILLPLLEQLGPDVVLAGYCLGGTMAIAAAAVTRIAGLALIASPWNFDGYAEEMRAGLARIWAAARPGGEALGLFPMEMLQSAFWQLDPHRTLSKFAAFAAMDPQSADARAFVALEEWANEGPPLPLPAARELFEDMFAQNLPGKGQWTVASHKIDLTALDRPVFNIISTTDRIVPAACAPAIGEKLILEQGHVGMVVGRRAEPLLWRPLSAWLSQLRHC